MSNKQKISIIVPAYNVEKYICRCLDSLLAQTHKNFEVLLIDDGSSDRSGAICDEYAQKDARIRVLHKDNGGVGMARQAGLDMATGEYVIHVDPDDWVESNMLEELYAEAKVTDADMVICDYYEHCNDGERYVGQQPKSDIPSDVVNEIFEGTLHGSCCNKLVRRKCIVNNQVSFPNLELCEDAYFNVALLMHPVKVSYLPLAFYHYDRTNQSSASRGGNSDSGLYAYKACQAFRSLLEKDQRLWTKFVYSEMPWMANLSLYYGSITSKQYKCAYQELSLRSPKAFNERLIRLALKHYLFARVIVQMRKIAGLIRIIIGVNPSK